MLSLNRHRLWIAEQIPKWAANWSKPKAVGFSYLMALLFFLPIVIVFVEVRLYERLPDRSLVPLLVIIMILVKVLLSAAAFWIMMVRSPSNWSRYLRYAQYSKDLRAEEAERLYLLDMNVVKPAADPAQGNPSRKLPVGPIVFLVLLAILCLVMFALSIIYLSWLPVTLLANLALAAYLLLPALLVKDGSGEKLLSQTKVESYERLPEIEFPAIIGSMLMMVMIVIVRMI